MVKLSRREPGSPSRTKELLKGVLISAAALGALANTACSLTEARDTPAASAPAEVDDGTGDSSGIDSFKKSFESLPAPVEVLAEPVVITEEVETRGQFIHEIHNFDPHIYSDYSKNLEAARSFIASLESSELKQEATAWLDKELSDAGSSTSGIYTFDDSYAEQSTELVEQKRGLAAQISNEEIKALTSQLFDWRLASEILRKSGDFNKAQDALMSLLPKEVQEQVLEAKLNDSDARKGVIRQRVDEIKTALYDLTRPIYDNWASRNPDQANKINEALGEYTKYRQENPDQDIPGAKDQILELFLKTNKQDPESMRSLREGIEAIPGKFSELKREAEVQYDNAVAYEVIHGRVDGGSIEGISEIVASTYDPEKKGLYGELLASRAAEEYGSLYTSAEPTEDDLMLMAALEGYELQAEQAKAIRGGDEIIKGQIEESIEAQGDAIFEIVGYGMFSSTGQNVASVQHLSRLFSGSNMQAAVINAAAAEYLRGQ